MSRPRRDGFGQEKRRESRVEGSVRQEELDAVIDIVHDNPAPDRVVPLANRSPVGRTLGRGGDFVWRHELAIGTAGLIDLGLHLREFVGV